MPAAVIARLALATLVVAAAFTADAETVFTGALDSTLPATDSPATGFARLELNDAQTEVAYEIAYGGLLGEEFVAHIHAGDAGNFGEIVHMLPLGTPKIGVWEPTPRQLAGLLSEGVSVVIHTDLWPEGEIGGRVTAEQTPVARRTWSAVRALLR